MAKKESKNEKKSAFFYVLRYNNTKYALNRISEK